MKTAEEILRDAFKSNPHCLDYVNVHVEAMKEYAREACLEQREKCAASYDPKQFTFILKDIILNAPEPELK